MSLPTKAKVVVIGGGIHGLSTAWKLSETYKNQNDIVVLEKKDTAAGASGIACGVVRNNYFQPAMRELMAHSVEVWESDPKAFKYNPVGYMQISPECIISGDICIYPTGLYLKAFGSLSQTSTECAINSLIAG